MSNSKTKDSNKSRTTTFAKKVSQAITTATTSRLAPATLVPSTALTPTAPTADFLPCITPEMKKSAIARYERGLRWEKQKTEKAMKEIIYQHTVPLVETLVDIAITDRDTTAINTLLDRGFGRANQNVNHGGQVDNPIVFLPASLMSKYKLHEGVYKPVEQPPLE